MLSLWRQDLKNKRPKNLPTYNNGAVRWEVYTHHMTLLKWQGKYLQFHSEEIFGIHKLSSHLISVEIHKMFLLIQFFRQMGFASLINVIPLPNINGVSFLNFESSLGRQYIDQVICTILFICYSCWKSSSNIVSAIWNKFLWCISVSSTGPSKMVPAKNNMLQSLISEICCVQSRYFWTDLVLCMATL